jgi:tRNA dimethylallyltransferase
MLVPEGCGMTNPAEKKKLALIAGPTASGKTALALRLAKAQDITIINADSAQVYDALPILSAQPSPEEMASVPHRLFGYRDVSKTCSAADWATDAKREIGLAWEAESMPVLVGGTGMYLQTLLFGIAPVPEINATIRAEVREMAMDDAYTWLKAVDPEIAVNLNPNDSQRIRRALEVWRSSGKTLTEWQAHKEDGIISDVDLRPMLLLPPREWLHARCDARFAAMMDGGAVAEVERLLALGLPFDVPVMRAIGVADISAMLGGEITEQEALLRGQAATRQYAKRQYTWFRNQTPHDWARLECELDFNNLDDIVRIFQ